jgi:hypothetical protein
MVLICYTVINGRLVAPVETALAQAVPALDRRHAVAVLDSTLHQRLVTREGLRRAHDLATTTAERSRPPLTRPPVVVLAACDMARTTQGT